MTTLSSNTTMGARKDHALPANFIAQLAAPLEPQVARLVPTLPLPQPQASYSPDKVSVPFLDMFRKVSTALTENGGHAFATTGSPLVDLFSDLAPGVTPTTLRDELEKAYAVDPHATVKIIFHARSIHEGKGFKDGFWICAGWLYEKHPRTLLANLHMLVDPLCQRERDAKRDKASSERATTEAFGVLSLDDNEITNKNLASLPQYPSRPHGAYDDLLDLLVLAVNDQLNATCLEIKAVDEAFAPARFGKSFRTGRAQRSARAKAASSATKPKPWKADYQVLGKYVKTLPQQSMQARLLSARDGAARHKLLHDRMLTKLEADSVFRALYLTVVDLFACQLRVDLDLLAKHRAFLRLPADQRVPFKGDSSPHLFGMSYAAKWAPTPGKSADRQTEVATALGYKLFPGSTAEAIRERLQREVLSPLRKVLKVPESSMDGATWRVDYTKVPSRCMKRNAEHFAVHDPVGFEAYLVKVAEGKLSMSGAALFPHEVLREVMKHEKNNVIGRVAGEQWKSLVRGIANSSNSQLKNCLAVADVSGSMGSMGVQTSSKVPQPIEVCIAMTLLLGELAEAPWNSSFFTFSSHPTLERIDPALSLRDRIISLNRAHWEMSTNLDSVFELILSTAEQNRLAPQDMIQRLFIFSDMQFDQATSRRQGESGFATIKRKFSKAGYKMPELVFWNLSVRGAAGTPKPVQQDEDGVALVSGYSAALMKYFLGQQKEVDLGAAATDEWVDEDGQVLAGSDSEKKGKSPFETMMAVIGAESFKGCKVVD